MEKLKPGRKPLPEDQKKVLVSAYVTREQKSLIINHYGNLSNAVVQEILHKLQTNGHSNSIRNRE